MQISLQRLAAIGLVASAFLGSVQAQNLKRIEEADFGKTQDGSEVKLITLRNSKGMSAQGHVIAAGWWKPETTDEPHVLNPIRKSFTSMTVGLAIADGKLTFSGGGFRRAISTCFRYRLRSRKHPS